MAKHRAVLGFRPHTGWAALVAVLPAKGIPSVIERRRITVEPAGGRFVYHQAAELPLEDAAQLIANSRAETKSAAMRCIGQIIEELETHSLAVYAAAIPAGNTNLPQDLSKILAAHSLVHAAEGVFYRESISDACEALNLSVHRPPERDLRAIILARTRLNAPQLDLRIREMGKKLGAPWGEDQKIAMLAAWATANMR